MTDDELLDGLQRGAARTQSIFIEEYNETLCQQLFGMKSLGAEDIEQVVFDVLCHIILNPSAIDLSKGSIRSYLFQAVHNRAIDALRKRKASLKGKRLVSLDTLSAETLEDAEERTLNVVDEYPTDEQPEAKTAIFPPEVIQAAEQLGKELRLTPRQYEHIRLRLVEKFEPYEVADFLGITPNNEAVSWHRLKTKVENNWEKYPALKAYAQQFEKEKQR